MHVSDEHTAIARKFPNRGIRTGHTPFANDAAVSQPAIANARPLKRLF
jgi:hypothetical protein